MSIEALATLLTDLEAATEPDRFLDLQVGLLAGDWVQKGAMVRDHEKNHHMMAAGGTYPALTESIDEAVSFLQYRLRGGDWLRSQDGMYLTRPGRDPVCGGHSEQPALGLVTAVVKALVTDPG